MPRVKGGNDSTKSLNEMIRSEKYPDIKWGIKMADANIGYADNKLTVPWFCAFLLDRYLGADSKTADAVEWFDPGRDVAFCAARPTENLVYYQVGYYAVEGRERSGCGAQVRCLWFRFERKMKMKEKGLFTLSPLLFAFLAGAATVDVTAENLEQDCTLVNGSTRGFGDVFGCVSIATPTGGAAIVGSAFMNPDGSSSGFKAQNFAVAGYTGKPEYARGLRGQVAILTVDEFGRFGTSSKFQLYWYDAPGTKYGWYDSKGQPIDDGGADIGSLGSGFMVTGAKDLKLLNAGFVNDGEITFDLPKCGACVLANPRSTRLHPTDVTVSGYTVPTSGAVTLSVLDCAGRAVWTCRWIDNPTYYPDGAGWYYRDETAGKMTICKTNDVSLCCEPGDGWWVQGPQNSQTTYKFTIRKRQAKVNE